MSHEEEQTLEIEALQSIFEEGREFTSISPKEFLLKLLPYPGGEQENHVGVTLHVTYTAEYPDVAPQWVLEDVKGLSDEKLEALKEQVEETINSSLGMAMIYTVAEACQDYLKANNVKALSMHEEMMQRLTGSTPKGGDSPGDGDDDEDYDDDDEDGPNEEDEWKGLADKTLCPESERITPESFLTWNTNFQQELIAAGIVRKDETKAKSGRMIFLETKAASGGEGEAGAEGKSDVLVYDAALFGEEDVDDLELDDAEEEAED